MDQFGRWGNCKCLFIWRTAAIRLWACYAAKRALRPKFSHAFFLIPHPFLSKYMQRKWKRWKSNLIRIFFDGRKFRRQCANVIDTTWGRIYFLTCENFVLSVQRPLLSYYGPGCDRTTVRQIELWCDWQIVLSYFQKSFVTWIKIIKM